MPNITPLKKKVVQLPFRGQDDFVAQITFTNGEDVENEIIFILDK
jgi:hypothetical protein